MLLAITPARAVGPHPFGANDLVTLTRLSDPQLSPDGSSVVYVLYDTDLALNRGVTSIWRLSLHGNEGPAQRLTATGSSSSTPGWSPDGRILYFLSDRSGTQQLWRLMDTPGDAQQVTHLPLPVNAYAVSPDGRQLLLALDVYPDCDLLACTVTRIAARATTAEQSSGRIFDQLFIRLWDNWRDGRRSQLFIGELDQKGAVAEEPKRLSRGIAGDTPTKPFGGSAQFAFSPDGRTVYFTASRGDQSEAWSPHLDIYAVPSDGSAAPRKITPEKTLNTNPVPSPDGRKLYYLARLRPDYDSDRFAIMELDIATGARREVDHDWDRSADSLRLSKDGLTLYVTADDEGEHPLFAIDIGTGRARRVAAGGTIDDFSVGSRELLVSRDRMRAPADLYRIGAAGETIRLTSVNEEALRNITFGDYETFRFPGWNGESVRGYVVKPVGFEPGRKYPVAFLIHGGPESSWLDDFNYRWNPETYAGAGFAVVIIDFHGSTGYGQAFADSIVGHWGDRPLEDLRKGWAAALARYPFLDAGRACALGASFGGYMINWIAGHWAQPWKCLVTHDGTFDNRMTAYSIDEPSFFEREQRGTAWQQPELYERFNPSSAVGAWRVPTLVIHSANDFRVPLEQGIATFTALQRRGIPSEFLYFPDENHWVRKPRNSLQWHAAVESWLRKWTSPTR